MCGINLIITETAEELRPVLKQMMQQTAFRGPDAAGDYFRTWNNGQLALGANRLRIVDNDENADQPMISDCGNYMLAYNGEIYNYHDLKSTLLREGQQFRTSSDSEVVLYWLKRNGANGLKELKGMFALVFLDLRQEKVLLARDKHGIKPLFYHIDGSKLVASSALSAIIKTNLVKKKLNKSAIDDYLNYRHVMGNHTFYAEIDALAPGTALEFHQGEVKTNNFSIGPSNEGNPDLKETLIDAITLTTNAQQTPGLLLSGGVDSTLLLAIYNQELGYHGLPTYTLNTGEDAKWSVKAAKQFGADHTLVEIGPADLERAIGFFDLLDQPIADHGALATWLITEKATVNHKVILSGAGADELLGGYNRHLAFKRYVKARKSWLVYKKLAAAFGYVAHPQALKTFLMNIDPHEDVTFKNFLKVHGLSNKHQVEAIDNTEKNPVADLFTALAFDKANYLVNDVLAITDLATMSHAVEARVPYLYDDVVAIADNISPEEKLGSKGKVHLKQLLSAYGGKAYTRRSKMGFGLPMAELMRTDKFPLWSILHNDDPVYAYVDETAIKQMKTEHLDGMKDWNMQLWSILVFSNWLKRNFI